MAMSKIEQAGVDAKAFKGLISVNSSSASEKAVDQEKESAVRAALVSNSALLKEDKLESTKEEEPAEIEERSDDKINVEVQSEVCNQVSEDKQDIDNPADDDDVNPEQESGSDGGDGGEVDQPESCIAPEQEVSVADALTADSSTEHDEETTAVIQQALSDMAATIEEEITAQSMTPRDIPTVKTEFETPRVEIIDYPEVERDNEVTSEPSVNVSNTPEAVVEEEKEMTPEQPSDIATEAKADTVDQTNVEIEVTEENETPAADSTDAPGESIPVEEAANAQPSAETTAQLTEQNEAVTHDEELEAKAMAKCMCGKCTIM
ncbi:Hypothetical protein PHPALM_7185 [Phytophthora palmivora]|uniref:Uncharacterized protein n=1 Tax=Phytophthora palmivora TaxID=4796 RepID=A0A2P4YCY6_9STRA|nr:Hypothetical protein PHPALM_7185 [Phytophthora palmivora]